MFRLCARLAGSLNLLVARLFGFVVRLCALPFGLVTRLLAPLRGYASLGRGPRWYVTASSAGIGALSHVLWDRMAVGPFDLASSFVGRLIRGLVPVRLRAAAKSDRVPGSSIEPVVPDFPWSRLSGAVNSAWSA
jgi:hypothetical protein